MEIEKQMYDGLVNRMQDEREREIERVRENICFVFLDKYYCYLLVFYFFR